MALPDFIPFTPLSDLETDKNNYLGKTIQVGGTKYKVTAAGFEKVRR